MGVEVSCLLEKGVSLLTREPRSLGWLGLWSLMGYAAARFWRLQRSFEDPAEALERLRADPKEPALSAWSTRELARAGGLEALGEAEADRVLGLGGWVVQISRTSGVHGAMPSPFPYRQGKGEASLLAGAPERWAAVVGSRRVDRVGLALAEAVVDELGEAGCVTVSGGALGIDAAAHARALSGGLPTVVVLGNGLARPYPSENRALFDRVAGQGGAVVSPFMSQEPARRHHFPRRNLVMAAMSAVTVVVRAGASSGSLITARAALRFGRAVLSVPADAGRPEHAGTNILLTEGAFPRVRASAVSSLLSRVRAGELVRGLQMELSLAARGGGAIRQEDRGGEELDGEQRCVLNGLASGPRSADELASDCGLPLPRLKGALLDLELEGRVLRMVGGRFGLV